MDHHAHHDHAAHMNHTPTPNLMEPMDNSTTMDHGAMDHGTMDHGVHGMMDHGAHAMMMVFHGGFSEIVLFTPWKIDTVGGLIASMIGLFVISTLYEGLKYYRELLFWKTNLSVKYKAVVPTDKENAVDENGISRIIEGMIQKQPRLTMFSKMHIFQVLLHVVQITVSYMLMLVFMTYNSWLCAAVVLGSGFGYFLFGWKKAFTVNVSEHCH